MKRAVIVGGGHNGLVCAAYLARAGMHVTVLERRTLVGGCAVTESPWPGYKISTASYLVSLLRDEIVRDLDLAAYGYKVYPKDPPFFTPFPDGRHLFMWQDLQRTLAEVARFSEKDAVAFPAYDEHLETLSRIMDRLELAEAPDSVPELQNVLEQSADEFLSRWFESPEIKVTLATDGVIGASGGPRAKGSAYVLLHHCMGMAAGRRGLWGFVRGGMGALSEAIASSARAAGAEIRTEASVAAILPNGVRLESGELFEADVVISGLHPRRTYQLVGIENWRPAFVSQGVSMKLNLALSGLPQFRGRPDDEGPEHRATIHICPSIDYMERAWRDFEQGRASDEPMIEMGFPSVYDDSLAPAGKHVASLFIQYIPYGANAEDFADRAIAQIEKFAPGFSNLILHRQALGPKELEERFGLEGGNIFHGDLIPSQLFNNRPRAKTEIPGLYLCGSGAHPGGGVMGASGYNAAQAVLKEF